MDEQVRDNNIKPNNGDIEYALRFGAVMGTPRAPGSTDLDAIIDQKTTGTPYVVLPEGYVVHGLERLLPEPARKRGAITTTD